MKWLLSFLLITFAVSAQADTLDQQIATHKAAIDSLLALKSTEARALTAARFDSTLNDTLRAFGIYVLPDTKDAEAVQLCFSYLEQTDPTKRVLLKGMRQEAENNEKDSGAGPGETEECARMRFDSALAVKENIERLMR